MARSPARAVTPEGVTQHEAGTPPRIVLDERGQPVALGSMPAGCYTYTVVIDERHEHLGLRAPTLAATCTYDALKCEGPASL